MSATTTSTTPDWVGRTSASATLLVACSAGALAAVASKDVALASGAITDERLAWALPVILEGGASTAGLLAWRRGGGADAWREWLALLALMGLAVLVNAEHAAAVPGSTWLGVVLASAPPVVVVGSIHLLLHARSASEATAAREREEVGAKAERERAKADRAQARERPGERARVRRAVTPGERQVKRPVSAEPGARPLRSPMSRAAQDAVVDAMLAEFGPVLTGNEVAARLDVSPATGRRRLAEAKARAAMPPLASPAA